MEFAIIGLVIFIIGGIMAVIGFYMHWTVSVMETFLGVEASTPFLLIGIIGTILAIVGGAVGIIGFLKEDEEAPMRSPLLEDTQSKYIPTVHYCPRCHSQLWWTDQYRSYYCAQCKSYIPAEQNSILDRVISDFEREINK